VTTLDPHALAGLLALNARCEGREPHPYLDSHKPPIVTGGVGCAFLSLADFARQPWQVDGAPASPDDVLAGWDALHRQPGGKAASFYVSVTPLRLTDAAIDALQSARLSGIAAALYAHFGGAWSTFPWQVQAALISIGYAAGAEDLIAGWPRLHAFLAAGDWAGAATECRMDERGNPGLHPRDDQQVAWMLEAAGEAQS
jgi:hypothetical protein